MLSIVSVDATKDEYNRRKSRNAIALPELGNESGSCEIEKQKNSSSEYICSGLRIYDLKQRSAW